MSSDTVMEFVNEVQRDAAFAYLKNKWCYESKEDPGTLWVKDEKLPRFSLKDVPADFMDCKESKFFSVIFAPGVLKDARKRGLEVIDGGYFKPRYQPNSEFCLSFHKDGLRAIWARMAAQGGFNERKIEQIIFLELAKKYDVKQIDILEIGTISIEEYSTWFEIGKRVRREFKHK